MDDKTQDSVVTVKAESGPDLTITVEAFTGDENELAELIAQNLSEAFHLRGVHWVPVPSDGTCPSSHPSKLKFPGTETLRCFTPSAASAVRARRESVEEIPEQERPPLKTQTYILSKERFKTLAQANKWMDDNDAPRPKVDEKETSFRYRQFPPDRCEEGSQRTVRITDGVQIVGCRLKAEFREAVTPFKDLPLADRTREWDSDEAKKRVRAWATTDDEIDFDKFAMAFVVVDGPKDNLTSYKLPFADFFDGRLRAVPRGVFAAAAVLQGARGGIDLPSGDLTRARDHLGRYYAKMELTPPWETREALYEQVEKLTNERARLREALEDNPTERCKFCAYFQEPNICKVIEGPVSADQVCDWIFSRETQAELYNISDEDWLAFVKGMIDQQPYQHIVKDGAITPAGPLVMIEDTAEPPHRFSLDKLFHVSHTSLEHHWTQAEVDALVKAGQAAGIAQENHTLEAIILDEPSGKLIHEGIKTWILKEHRIDMPSTVLIVTDDLVWGMATIGEPLALGAGKLRRTFDKHRISETARQMAWPNAQVLWAYPIKEFEKFDESIRPLFGSPGGKRHLARTIVALFPDHKKYVEPFAGAAAVFFAKKPSPAEVLNDTDVAIIEAFRFAQSAKNGEIDKLRKMPTKASRAHFNSLLNGSVPTGSVSRFHHFLYLNAFSMVKARKSFANGNEAIDLIHKYDRMDAIRERLQGVHLRSGDFRKTIRDHDASDTFFYIDPPYPTQQGQLKTGLTNDDVLAAVKGIKGKFILSLPNDTPTREAFKSYHKKSVEVRRILNMGREHMDRELLISNFPPHVSRAWFAEASSL